MKNIKLLLTAGVLLVVAGSCAVTDFDRTANFYNYHTFAWGDSKVDADNPLYKSELIEKNIRHTVERELAARGIMRDQYDPDFIISYHTYTEQKKEVRNRGYHGYGSPYFRWGFYPYFGWGIPYAWHMPSYEEKTYTEGTLIIDISDSRTKALVWRGSVSGNIDNVNTLQKQIRKGVKAIMKKYPVTPQEPLPLYEDNKIIS